MSGRHPHDHAHDHAHHHVHRAPPVHQHEAGQGPVVIDIGSGTGALVVRTGPDLVGVEIDITPVGHDDVRRHVAVHTRPVPGHPPVHAAVYDGLVADRYRLWWPPGEVAGEVVVVADGVTDIAWEDVLRSTPRHVTA